MFPSQSIKEMIFILTLFGELFATASSLAGAIWIIISITSNVLSVGYLNLNFKKVSIMHQCILAIHA